MHIATISNEDVTFTRDLGTTVRHDFDTRFNCYEKYRIRIRYFHHMSFIEIFNVHIDIEKRYAKC